MDILFAKGRLVSAPFPSMYAQPCLFLSVLDCISGAEHQGILDDDHSEVEYAFTAV